MKYSIMFSMVFTMTIKLYAQANPIDDIQPKNTIIIKTELLPSFLYFVKGSLKLSNDSLNFSPASECFEWKLLRKIYPCHNELFGELRIPIASIVEIKRRNTLLIIPNKFLVKLKDGRKYKFFSFKRGRIIQALKKNPLYGV